MTQLRPRPPGTYESAQACSNDGAYEESPRLVNALLGNALSLQYDPPSTSYKLGSYRYNLLALMREDSTSSRSSFVKTSDEARNEAPKAYAVNPRDANANIFEIQRITGLGWGQLADMLNVDRRTVHNWIKGRRVRHRNGKRIADALDILRRIDQGSAQENQVILSQESPKGSTVLEMIRQMRYEEVLALVSSYTAPVYSPSRAERTGEYQAIAIHQGADGSEIMEALPYEPQPPARKRVLRRD